MNTQRWWSAPRWLLVTMLVLAVRGYQLFLRPLLPPSCRYTPGCSDYFILAVQKYGPITGSLKGVWRICRCHPFCPGGYDPP
jgi:putative membrane protein insertion efficiency factor